MKFAHPQSLKEKRDVSPIVADQHQGEQAYCIVCGDPVVSQKVNNVWQWVHVKEDKDDLP